LDFLTLNILKWQIFARVLEWPFSANVAEAVRCYSCDSTDETGGGSCLDPFSTSGVSTVSCTYGCSKSKVEVNGIQGKN